MIRFSMSYAARSIRRLNVAPQLVDGFTSPADHRGKLLCLEPVPAAHAAPPACGMTSTICPPRTSSLILSR